jgi:hypothetical protein
VMATIAVARARCALVFIFYIVLIFHESILYPFSDF